MENMGNDLRGIDVPSDGLDVSAIQKLMVLTKDTKSNYNKEFWDKAALLLWKHITHGLKQLDDQLLCATCFYSVVKLTTRPGHYIEEIMHKIKTESKSTLQVVSLMYGMFQSSFLVQTNYSDEDISITALVLERMFDLLILMGYENSQYTFITFKTIKSFNKVCEGPFKKCMFNKENQEKLLELVNNNWENPTTGVRDLNRSIFQTLLSTLDDETYQKVLQEIDKFYWNKAKFLMLSEVIEHHKGDIMPFINHKWIDGLIYSLHKPGLVSAGADMYYALLKNISTQDDWCQLFLYGIINILKGTNVKAVENFSNYWCLTTMKKFGTLAQVLIEELERLDNSEQVMYSKLSIMRQANKLGIVDKKCSAKPQNVAVQKAVLNGIDHCNNHIRILAFDIICVSHRKSVPTVQEYKLIINYLHNNVNCDSTVLRLNMLSSFNTFLTHLHSIFLNLILKEDKMDDLENLLNFCKGLQTFIVDNVNINGNYQRKITTVKLCNSILTCFSQIPKKRKDQTREADKTLLEFLYKGGCWLLSAKNYTMKLISLLKDPADDIRDNVAKILLTYYAEELKDVSLLTNIINDAKKCMRSKFFYEISCGESMYRLLTNLLIKEKNKDGVQFKSVESIFDYAFNDLIIQHEDEINVMNSIEEGKQLHSLMCIVLVVLQECHLNAYKIDIQDKMPKLLNVLESISKQFSWEEKGSSDFAKINAMVQDIITESDYNCYDEDDHTKISGLEQIVLNCLWLNVKVSCDLASILIQYNKSDVSMCNKCLNIIACVLETSRHKGAIEAAGAALGRAIKYLTSLPVKEQKYGAEPSDVYANTLKSMAMNNVSQLPYTLLQRKLKALITETNTMSSITRRGAGLSIMVHRIVSNDMSKGKPLFHYFMKTLLKVCNSVANPKVEPCGWIDELQDVHLSDVVPCITQPTQSKNKVDDNIENQLDVPKAIYIHFMTRIVTDSSLATDLMYYSVDLAELAFRNLTSQSWQIRNAALQLYGALVPRLIGQKKASGTDAETTATVACDEMRTHFPKLWQYITEQIKQNNGKDTIQSHSNLIPILNILANSARRYHISLHESIEEEIMFRDLFYHLILLLSSPIYTVRRLTAKTIFNIYEFEYISDGILKHENITENILHGFLILTQICYNYYSAQSTHARAFGELRNKYQEIFSRGEHAYLCKQLFENIYVNDIALNDIEKTITQMNKNLSPGADIWAEARLKKYIDKCTWDDIPSLLPALLQQNDYDKYCEMFLAKITTQNEISTDMLLEIANILMSFEKRDDSSVIWEILYEISRKIKTPLCIDAKELLSGIKATFSYPHRYMIPLIAKNISSIDDEDKSSLLEIINNLSDFENSDVDMRFIAAIANNELAHEFNKLPDSLKVISMRCAVFLLQDEDEDIRNLSVAFYAILSKEAKSLQPYICLNNILTKKFLNNVFSEPQHSIQEFSAKLLEKTNLNHNRDEYNPFANDSKNIYYEPNLLKEVVSKLSQY